MNVCEKIDAFENHVLNRQLRIAQILGKHFVADADSDPLSESAFVIISIVFSYFEMIEQFAVGQSSHGQSGQFFERGFRRVFPTSTVDPSDAARLYSMIRCGMYHLSMPTDRCGLTRELKAPIANENGALLINPKLLTDELITHFAQFCSDLRDGLHCELQQNFETMFDGLGTSAATTGHATTNTTPAPWDQT